MKYQVTVLTLVLVSCDASSFGSLLNSVGHLIVPGTKWCGKGDIAANYSDLGYFRSVDACCRAHDTCNETISSGESLHGLTNTGRFKRVSCLCDRTFNKCLKSAKSIVGDMVGTIFFNGFGGKCFENTYPAKCAQYKRIFGIFRTCVKYEFDTSKKKEYQWLDASRYM